MTSFTQEELFEQSKTLVPGGVHSPVRSFKGLKSTPRFFKKAKGAYLTDINDKDYIDFCMSFGPLILGHQDPDVLNALTQQLENGWSYGACEPYSYDLAKLIVDRISFIDQIRFVNSGTEAVMTTVRLARGATGKNKIIKFNGCYHGHLDSLLIKAGSGLAGTPEASSAGIPQEVAKDTIVIELGDFDSVEQAFKKYPNEIALVAIEPLPANNGLIPLQEEFLRKLREITKQYDSLLLFDEVISGFRVGFGGMAEKLNITPDLVTYGKIIGGGLPVGAVAGPKSVMEHLSPIGNVYQAGTLSANPLAMVGGYKTLSKLTAESYQEIEKNTLLITQTIEKWLKEYNNSQFSNYNIIQYSSLFWLVPGKQIQNISQMPSDLADNFVPLFELLLKKGIYLSPNAFEVGFASLAHNQEVCLELERRLWNELE